MFTTSRRTFVASAAAAGAAFGLDKPLAIIPSAHAQKVAPNVYDKGFARFMVGDVEVTTLYDGATLPRDFAVPFARNASNDDIKAALKAGGLSDAFIPNWFTVTVIKTKGKYVMFDSSTGGQLAPTAGLMMAKNMYAAGIVPSKISTIVVTHFHPDHISGMISKETNSQVFPDAEIIMPEAEYKHWTAPDLLGKVPDTAKGLVNRIQATFPKWKNIKQVKDGQEVYPGIRAVASYGHTPGHTSYIVSSGSKQLLVGGDLTNIQALNFANPGMHLIVDADPAMAEASRRKLFDRVIADKMIATGYHWGMPGAGTLKKDGNGYALVPVKA